MKILLDTHCWLWWLAEPERLRDQVLRIIEDVDNEVFLSVASAWEIAIKYSLGKLSLPEAPGDFVPKRLERDGILPLLIANNHALRVAELPSHHRDPFDRFDHLASPDRRATGRHG